MNDGGIQRNRVRADGGKGPVSVAATSTGQRFRLVLLVVAMLLATLPAPTPVVGRQDATPQPSSGCLVVTEPNDHPEDAIDLGSGRACAIANEHPGGQDLYAWTVTEAVATQRWTFTLSAIPGQIGVIEAYMVERDATGTVIRANKVISAGGAPSSPVTVADLLWPTGTFYIGVATSGAGPYTLTIEPGAPLPNRSSGDPIPATGLLDISGTFESTSQRIAWTIGEQTADTRLDLRVQAPVGTDLSWSISNSTGSQIFSNTVSASGTADLRDIGLDPGTYLVTLTASDESVPWAISATDTGDRTPDREHEPNDIPTLASAIPIDGDAGSISGRLATTPRQPDIDVDYLRLAIDDSLAGRFIDVRLIWPGAAERQLCLVTPTGTDVRCVGGSTGLAFNDLVLAAGDYILRVSGPVDVNDDYVLKVSATGEAVEGFEFEPNDTSDLASPLIPDGEAFTSAGRLQDGDIDFFRVTMTGDSQLWLVEVAGDGITGLSVLTESGNTVTQARLPRDGLIQIYDLYLLPGDHVLQPAGAGDYTVRLIPLGPPVTGYEVEPNDMISRSMPIRLLEERSGRLATTEDIDFYRFSLQGETRLQLSIQPPINGGIVASLDLDSANVVDLATREIGQPLEWTGVLPAGDYAIMLRASNPSTEHYRITLAPLNSFLTPDDREPNDSSLTAAPFPSSGQVSGQLDPTAGDRDWYLLNPLDTPLQVVITYPDQGVQVALHTASVTSNGMDSLPTSPGSGAGQLLAELPADMPIFLELNGTGSYTIRIDPADQPMEISATPAPGETSILSAELVLDNDTPAAYWTAGQLISGTFSVTNDGNATIEIDLTAHLGHTQWTVLLETDATTIPTGESVDIPVQILVAPDPYANTPIAVAIEARSEGAAASAMAVILPRGDAVPVNSFPWQWVPGELEGGLNVAWTGLDANPVALDQADVEAQLPIFNESARSGEGFVGQSSSLPFEFTINLAGDEPVPVAGFVVYPAGRDSNLAGQAREYEIQLSQDGTDFTTVASGEFSAERAEQPIVLDESVNARFARLRILSTQAPDSYYAYIGEWKVIAEPGWNLSEVPLNLADPAVGGHVVDLQPPPQDPTVTQTLVASVDRAYQVETPIDSGPSFVIGFHHDRAAQVTGIAWLDPLESNPEAQITAISVETTIDSPIGPWSTLGQFDLQRDANGAAFVDFESPTWVRFVRITAIDGGQRPDNGDAVTWELPGQVLAHERPANEAYRSILGQWGNYRTEAIYEQSVQSEPLLLDPNAGDSAEAATSLALDTRHTDTVAFDLDEDWFSITIPPGQPALELELGGIPSVGVGATLFDATGGEIPLTISDSTANQVTFSATVNPGDTYHIRIAQTPASIVFAFDTSLSVANFLPTIFQGLVRFSGDVLPGREFVTIHPFGESFLLDDWSDDSFLLQATINNYPDASASSDAHGAIVAANEALMDRRGTRAIVLITDGENTPGINTLTTLWPGLESTAPRIYSVGIGGTPGHSLGQDVMQDWALVNSGHYVYVNNQAEMDVAFDRAATDLRRPAIYAIVARVQVLAATPIPASTPTPEPQPTPEDDGFIQVLAPPASVAQPAPLPPSQNGQVAIILDTSGSMLQQIDGQSRADVAKTSLIDLVSNTIPASTMVSLRTFGDTPDSCETILVVPPEPLDPDSMSQRIANLPIVNLVRTPIGASLEAVAGDLTGAGPRIVVLVTDGEETCDGDAATAIQNLAASSIDVRVNIVGFAIDDPMLQTTFAEWAQLGNGQYIDAANAEELNTAIAQTVMPTYQVFNNEGTVVVTGQVGSEPVALPPGTYRLVVQTDPEIVIEHVVVTSGQPTDVSLPRA